MRSKFVSYLGSFYKFKQSKTLLQISTKINMVQKTG